MGEDTAVASGDLGTEAVELLGELIRFDTVNPPGNEEPAQEMLAERLRDAGFECTLLAAEAGPAEPDRRSPRRRGRRDPLPARTRGHGPGRSRRVDLRPLGGRRRRRRGPRSRRPGHEGPGRRGGRRGDRPRALGLAPGSRRAEAGGDGRRGDGRGRGRSVALPGASGGRAQRPRPQRGRRRVVRARRAPLLHALRRREGRQPLPAAGPRPRRARVCAGPWRQRPAQARPRARPPQRPAAAGADARRASPSSRGCSPRASPATTRPRSRERSSACAGCPRRSPPTSPSRCCA